MVHHLSPSKIIALSALGVLCCANLGYASWTYVSGDVTAEGLVNVSVGSFNYVSKAGWYDVIDKKEVFNNDYGFEVKGATYNTDHSLASLPSNASNGLTIINLKNYKKCPVLYLPHFITFDKVDYPVVAYDPEGASGVTRGTASLFYTMSQDKKTYWITATEKADANPSYITKISFYLPGETTNSKLAYIGTRAFAYLPNVDTMNLSGCVNLTYIDEWAFTRCNALKYFSLPTKFSANYNQSNSYFANSKGNLYGALSMCFSLETFDFTQYENITNLPFSFLRDCYSLTSIKFSKALTTCYDHVNGSYTKAAGTGDTSIGCRFFTPDKTSVTFGDESYTYAYHNMTMSYNGTTAEFQTALGVFAGKNGNSSNWDRNFLYLRTVDTAFSGAVTCTNGTVNFNPVTGATSVTNA